MNVYSELLELLTPERKDAPAGLFGTLTAVSPLTVTVRGTALTEGLFYLQGTVFREEDIGRELALLSCDLSRLGHSPRHRAGGGAAAVPGVGRGLGERMLRPAPGRAVFSQRR